jgi:hypothetical protein
MSDSESAIAGFYDHEQETTRSRREREAPDWGGDDLFTSTPRRRRFDRPARGEQRTARRRETLEHPLPRRMSGPAAAPRLDLGVVDAAPVKASPPAAESAPAAAPVRDSEVEAHTMTPPPAGRRTVLVTGHPDPVPVRRRPAPTMDERLIGSRPERIASYAFALGLLLILIAFLTAHA